MVDSPTSKIQENKTKTQHQKNSSLIFNKSRTCIEENETLLNAEMHCEDPNSSSPQNNNVADIEVKPLDLTDEIKK